MRPVVMLSVRLAGRHVVDLAHRRLREPFVVAEIEVGLGAVISHEHFAVLIRRHRAWIDVEVGVELAQANLVAPRLQQRTESGGCETFAK